MDVNGWILLAIGGWFILIAGGIITGIVILFRLRRRYQKIWVFNRDDASADRVRTKQEVNRLEYDNGSYFWSEECSRSLKWWGIPFGRQCDFFYGIPYAIDFYSEETRKSVERKKELWKKQMDALNKQHFDDLKAKDAKMAEFVKKSGFMDVQSKFWNAKDIYDYIDTKVVQKFIYSEDVLEFIKLLVIITGAIALIVLLVQVLWRPPVVSCLNINQTITACRQALMSKVSAAAGQVVTGPGVI